MVEMTAIAQHPELRYFIDYIDLVSSHYEAGPLQSTLPSYNGPPDERIERTLKALARLAKRAYTAEDMLAQVRAAENIGPETKKRRSLDVPETIQSIGSSMSSYNGFTNNKPGPSVFFTDLYQPTFPSNGVRDTASSVSDSDTEMNVDPTPTSSSATSDSTINGKDVKRSGSPMSISLDGLSSIDSHRFYARPYSSSAGNLSWSAPPSSHGDSIPCPTCGKPLGDTTLFAKLRSYNGTEGSPLVVPPGPLVAAAFESGLSAVEELRLLKAQVQDVARVCNAVARGDLSQKITVPVQGVVMVQLKDVINTMVREVRITKQ
jgi:osomolarity two-component system sensor histidine kinase NIK1